MYLALREMRYTKGKYILIICLIALISYLVFFLSSLANGLATANKSSISYWEADGIILSDEANNNLVASTIEKEEYKGIDAENKYPVNLAQAVSYVKTENKTSEKINVTFMGLGENSSLMPEIVEGDKISNSNEAVVSESMKKEQDVKLEDVIVVPKTGREFKVVGFTKETKYNTAPVIYTELDMSSQAMMMYSTGDESVDAVASPTEKMPERLSGIVISDKNFDKSQLNSGLKYLEINEFINSIPGYKAQVLTFGIMIGFLIAIASIIVAIFMYILTMQKTKIFGVLKAQGISNKYIGISVICQTAVTMICGIVMGFLLNYITSLFVPAQVPLVYSAGMLMAISLVMFVFSILGTLFSVRVVLKIDPLKAIS